MQPSSQTLCRIASVVSATLGVNVTEKDLQGVTRLDQLFALDSMSSLELAMSLEHEFAIRLDPDCMNRDFLVDVSGLVRYFDRDPAGKAR